MSKYCPKLYSFIQDYHVLIVDHVRQMSKELFDLKEEMRLLRQQIAATLVPDESAQFPMTLPATNVEQVKELLHLLEDEAQTRILVSAN